MAMISAEDARLHNEAMLQLRLEGWESADALSFIYPDPDNDRTWLCNRAYDA